MAPIIKNCVSFNFILTIKGEIPITKNVVVTDEKGITYEPTYPRRAKGLVKSGRARWVDENTICLISPETCPPSSVRAEEFDITEDITMSENTVNVYDSEILERIDLIITQQDYIEKTIDAIVNFPVNDSPHGGFDGQARGEALQKVVEGREETNRAIIRLLDKMYTAAHPETGEKFPYPPVDLQKIVESLYEFDGIDADQVVDLVKTYVTRK